MRSRSLGPGFPLEFNSPFFKLKFSSNDRLRKFWRDSFNFLRGNPLIQYHRPQLLEFLDVINLIPSCSMFTVWLAPALTDNLQSFQFSAQLTVVASDLIVDLYNHLIAPVVKLHSIELAVRAKKPNDRQHYFMFYSSTSSDTMRQCGQPSLL